MKYIFSLLLCACLVSCGPKQEMAIETKPSSGPYTTRIKNPNGSDTANELTYYVVELDGYSYYAVKTSYGYYTLCPKMK